MSRVLKLLSVAALIVFAVTASTTGNRITSEQGINALKFSEGIELTAYRNFVNEPWTICYGHTGSDVYEGKTATPKECEDLLRKDLRAFEHAVNSAVTVKLYQWQYDSLVNFAYNIGEYAFKDSTLVSRLNSGGYNKVTEQLDRWVYVGDTKVTGQVNRRNREGLMFVGVGFEQYSIKHVMTSKQSLLRTYAQELVDNNALPNVKHKISMSIQEQKESRQRPTFK